jgi:hypothetical protein
VGNYPMRIVILNDSSEAVDYIKNHQEVDDVILPIGPTARNYALENGCEFRTLGSLWSKNDYITAKEDSEKRIKTLITELNEYSKSVAKNFPLTIGDYFSFQLHIVIGQIHYNKFIIDSIQKTLKPDSWLLYQHQGQTLFMDFRPNPNFIIFNIFVLSPYYEKGVLLKLNSEHKENTNIQGKGSWKQTVLSIMPKVLVPILIKLRFKTKTNNWFSIGKNRLLQIGSAYEWESVFMDREFKKDYYVDIVRTTGLINSAVISKRLLTILNNSITFIDIPVFDLTEQSKIIQGTLDRFDKQVLKLKSNIKKYHAILSTVFVFPMQNLIGHLANTLDKPVINWQHGVMNLYDDLFTESVETKYTTHYLCYGLGVKPKYDSHIGHAAMKKVFAVGSTKKINWESSQFILYATGKWMKTAIPFIEVQDPDTRLFEAQKDILAYLDSIGNQYSVIFKGNNTPGLNEISFCHKNIKFNETIPFTTLLKNAKLVILDTPATTCVETCSTTVPLFVLTGRSDWYKKPTKLLQKRALLAGTTAELIHNVKNYLNDNIYPADINNREFSNEYGSQYSSQRSVTNSIKALNEIL